jgi:type IV pilus assembly protein PilC
MPEFICRLGTTTGQIVQRVCSGETEQAVREELEQQDLLILSMRRKLGLALPFSARRRIPATEFLLFNQELMALIRAGLPILASLDMLIERRKNPVFRRALVEIRDQVKGGASLSEAFEMQGDLFPRLYATSLASGERSGEIASVLRRYIDYTRSIASIRKRVIAASIYPIVLVLVMIAVISIIMVFVFPKFAGFFSDMKAELPLPTRILLGGSLWVRGHLLPVLILLIGAVTAAVLWVRTEGGRRGLDRYKIRVPLVGVILHRYALTRFTRTLGTLVAGGIPLVSALQTAGRTVDNTLFSERLDEAGRKVREGRSLWQSLDETGLMSDLSIEMIKVGESTGALTEMLDNISLFYENEIETRVQTLLSLLEPVLLLSMAVVIGGLLLAIYMPLLSSFSSAKF